MTPNDIVVANEWFARAEKDRRAADVLLKAGEDADPIAVLIQQAVEKYIKGYLLCRGWKLRRIHDVDELLYDAIPFNPAFNEFLDFGRIVSMFYSVNRYPTGSKLDIPLDELKDYLTTANRLIALIKADLGTE